MGAGLYYKKGQNKDIPKTAKQMERHLKGIANHCRINVMFLVADKSGITVEDIARELNYNFKTLSVHIFRLVNAGLIDKKHKGRNVTHHLTPYGKIFVSFLNTFSHS